LKKTRNTVRGRFVLINTTAILLCFLLLAAVSLYVVYYTIENRGKSYMASGVDMICSQMEHEYQNALQISQQMLPQGAVGQALLKIMRSATPYEKYEAEDEFTRLFSVITFVTSQPELSMYYDPQSGSMYKGNTRPKASFDKSQLATLFETSAITYQPIHQSQSYISNYDVLSISREAKFLNDLKLLIYVEVRTNALKILENLSINRESNYELYLTDKSGSIRFATDGGAEELSLENLSDGFGRSGKHVYFAKKAAFGFYCVLVEEAADFYDGMFPWLIGIIAVMAAIIVILLSSVLIFNRIILAKLKKLMVAIGSIREDTLVLTGEKTGLMEFDLLTDKFSELLARIRRLISDLSLKEQERTQLELENLYFRINPHFLKNSLNAVYWIARMRKQSEISEIVHSLIEILSYTLGKSGNESTIRTEIEAAKAYITVEKHRHDFEVEYDIENGAYLDAASPRLILQPLAENAIGHGLNVGGKLILRVRPTDQGAIVRVEDDGCGISPELLEKLNESGGIRQNAGIGLKYVENMLRSFYGESAKITFESREGEGTAVSLLLEKTDEEDKGE